METILTFLSENPTLAVFLSLAIGYCVGVIKIGSFTVGATIGTLLTAFVLSRLTTFEVPGILVTFFSILFCFTIGYEAGPAFFQSLRSQGLKYVLQAIFFCAVSFLCLYPLGAFGILDRDTVIGMAAGALTQTSILTVAEGLGDTASVVYAVTYIFGTVLAILFAAVIGPAMLRTNPKRAVREYFAAHRDHAPKKENGKILRVPAVSVRAYRVEQGARYVGMTVEELEDAFSQALQVIKLFRGEKENTLTQGTRIAQGDIVTVISPLSHLITLDDEHMTELGDSQYCAVDLVTEEIIITESLGGSLVDYLSDFGIVLQSVTVRGREIPFNDTMWALQGATIRVTGVGSAIRKATSKLGYIKEISSTTDVPYVFFAVSVAVVLGALKMGGYSFGDSTCALILGLICGWFSNRQPKYGNFPEGTRWFLKSVGLNLFIAAKALTTGAFAVDRQLMIVIGIGMLVTIIPHIATALFCRYVMKMTAVDNLGGICGSGTCNAALNALEDATGSSAFNASFATTNAVSNILLTVVGAILAGLLL